MAFKSKLKIINAATYMALFRPDTNNCFFHMFSAIYSYLSLLFSHSVFLFSPSLSFPFRLETHSTIYNFDLIPLQPTRNITE